MPAQYTPFSSPPSFLGTRIVGVGMGDKWSAPRLPESSEPLWPPELLEQFTLRMMRNGQCVSSVMMQRDRRYSLAQLAYAHSIDDDVLRDLARDLFKHFEQRQPGTSSPTAYN